MIVKGYACHYNKPNLNRQIVDENSFVKALKERKESNLATPINYCHDSNDMIGKVLNFYSDSEGLFIEAELIDEMDTVKNKVLPLIKNGVIDSFSTEGYISKSDIEKRPNNAYYINNFDLTAIAVVNNPADRGAKFITNGKTCFDAFETNEEVNKPDKNRYIAII